MKKRSFVLLVSVVMMGSILLGGCGATKSSLVEGKINVVTSFYPLYDFTRKIGGEHVNVINLVPAGVEPHDWAPKSTDMKNITKAEVFVYNGAGFEGWVDDFLKGLEKDSKLEAIEASRGVELIDATEEEHEEEGHEEEGENHAEEGNGHEEDGDDHGQYDPHVWVSPLSAKKLAENIKMALIKADTANEADYEANYQELIVKLDVLSEKFKAVVAKSARKDIIVSHGAFGYM
ncbi:MAG TPA: zinc ABC transporter substrate-binding protein, partial [Bacilli bacterium]